MNVEKAVRDLKKALEQSSTPERALGAQRYLKSQLKFLGATVPAIRREARSFVRAHPELERATLKRLSEQLWNTDVHELRSVAIGILEARADLLKPTDANWLIALVRRADTWAHVDWLAIKVIGALVEREARCQRLLDAWARDASFWVRRTALLALHDPLLAGKGDFEHFARLAVPMLHEREFFIRKAIGWVLRAVSRRAPQRTAGFVARYGKQMSGLTFKEATRRLSASRQKKLCALREALPRN